MKDYQLTSKGSRALDNMRIELPASAARVQNNQQAQTMMLHILTMIRNGADEEDMVEELTSRISFEVGEVTSDNARGVLASMVELLEVTDHITVSESEDEDPPEFMGDFKDHF